MHTSFHFITSSTTGPPHLRTGKSLTGLFSNPTWIIGFISYVNSLGAIADVDLAIRSRNIKDDIMVVSYVIIQGLGLSGDQSVLNKGHL